MSAFRGCCALKFIHALDIHQDYLAHTPTETWVPVPPPKKKKNNHENLKFGLKFMQRVHVNNFGSMGVSSQIFIHDDMPRARGYNVGTIFGRLAP